MSLGLARRLLSGFLRCRIWISGTNGNAATKRDITFGSFREIIKVKLSYCSWGMLIRFVKACDILITRPSDGSTSSHTVSANIKFSKRNVSGAKWRRQKHMVLWQSQSTYVAFVVGSVFRQRNISNITYKRQRNSLSDKFPWETRTHITTCFLTRNSKKEG